LYCLQLISGSGTAHFFRLISRVKVAASETILGTTKALCV
jgi:hypothetical protein